LSDEAIAYWHKAGESALQRMALKEAIAHLTKGIELLHTLPASSQRDARELILRSLLGKAWMALAGWAVPDLAEQFSCALKLAKALKHRQSYVPVLFGLHAFDLNRGCIVESLKWVDEMCEAAETFDNPELKIMWHVLALLSHWGLGHFPEAHDHGECIAALYRPEHGRIIEQLTNHDPLVRRGMYDAFCMWLMGYPDQALQLFESAETLARAYGHPFGLAHVLTIGSWVLDLRGEVDRVLVLTDEGERLGRQHGMRTFSEVTAPWVRALALVNAGEVSEGAHLRDALDKWKALGGEFMVPYSKAVLAGGMAQNGAISEAESLIRESLEQIERAGWGERSCLAEVLRIRGSVLSLKGEPGGAEQSYLAALECARRQKAKGWELRAATSLARLWRSQGKDGVAHDLLNSVYGWFREGFGTRDMKDARSLLAEWTYR
jgi:predicted ATPase